MTKSGRVIMAVAVSFALFRGAAADEDGSRLMLEQGWFIQSSAKVELPGAELSTPGIALSDWHNAAVPSTVLAALVANGVYPDPYFGKNLRSIPGGYPKPLDISASRQPLGSPFRKSWWYRTEFKLPSAYQGKSIRLHFNGITYRANVWLNGRLIADSETALGTYTIHEMDVTETARPGETNALAVEVFPPLRTDLAMTWVDWNPAPPDRDMGIWREVYITSSGPVAIRHPHVITDLETPTLDRASLTVMADVINTTDQPVTGVLRGMIGTIRFSKPVELEARETHIITFRPDEFTQLVIDNPRLWWPAQLGPQNLYKLDMEFMIDNETSDKKSIRFGVRKIDSVFEGENLVFRINGKNILIRGAGWTMDMMLRQDPERVEAEVRYVKEMNMNTIRLEGKLESDHFYDVCDREGILVIAGWCCCHHWERWHRWDREDHAVAEASQRSQLLRLRHHPCMLAWMNGSDNPPPYDVEKMYLDVAQECAWPNPTVSSATEKPADYSGPSGVKMNGPYEWVPPLYWYEDPGKYGGAWSFNTETSPGPAIPPAESMRRMLPEDKLWPINDYWTYHAGRNLFGNVKVFTKAQDERYGKSESLEEYTVKAQAMAYEGQRAMMEAFGRNKYLSTGVIQWMLNDSWPSIIWHLYDYYLTPAGGYFGTQKGCEPLHIQYSYDDRSVVVVNSFYREFPGLIAKAALYNLDMTRVFHSTAELDAAEDSSTKVMTVPEPEGLSTTYFLDLELTGPAGEVLSENFYWLSTTTETLNWPLSQWYYTPVKIYADFTGLNSLPEVGLKVEARSETSGDKGAMRVKVENPSDHLAFMVRLKITGSPGGDEVLPVFWEDNYFSLIPGEQREVTASFRLQDLGSQTPALEVGGYNVVPETIDK